MSKLIVTNSIEPPMIDPEVKKKLMEAVETKNLDDLLQILRGGLDVNHHMDSFAETTLHKAVQLCWEEGVRTLLSFGAKVFTKNHFDQTPLHYAACARSVGCTRLLLVHEQNNSTTGGATAAVNHRDHRGRTALHDAAEQSSVEVINLLLKAGATVDVADSKDKETPLHKAAKSCAIPAMLALLNGGACLTDRGSSGESVLSYTLRHIPGGMEALFDSCLLTNTSNQSAKNLEVKFNFIPCISSSGEKNQMRCLWNIVDYGHAKLLKHPLCETFLFMKWCKVKKFFYIQFMYFFLYALLTTLLTFNKFLENDCPKNMTMNYTSNEMTSYPYIKAAIPYEQKVLSEGWRIALLSIVLIQAILILFQLALSLIYTFNSFKFSFWNILHVVIALLVFMVLPFDVDKYRYAQQHLAAILQLLLWTQCMLLVGQIPQCGIYVVMFTRVAGVFVKIFGVYFSLLLAFTFSFHISEGKMCSTIVGVFLTFLKTLTMMIGELDYNDEFVAQLEYLPFTSHIIFLLFVILVAIILSNLLVALAVNDVQSLRNSANLERLIKQMELVFEMEQSFNGLSNLIRHLRLEKFSVYSRRATLFDHQTTSVSIQPYHPRKSNQLIVCHGSCRSPKQEKIPFRLTSSVLDCVRTRMESFAQNRKPSTRPARLKKLRSSEYNNNEDMKDCLKKLESNLSDMLCDRLSEVLTVNAGLCARLTTLENELRILRRRQSFATSQIALQSSLAPRPRDGDQHYYSQSVLDGGDGGSGGGGDGGPAARERRTSHHVDVRGCKSLDPRSQGTVLHLQGVGGHTWLDDGNGSDCTDVTHAEHDV